MNDANQAGVMVADKRPGVTVAWDELFGLHLQVCGGPAEAKRVMADLDDAGIEARSGAESVGRLRRPGWEPVLLHAAERDKEPGIRGCLAESGYPVEPPEGLEIVPCPYGERLRPLLRHGSYFDGVKPAAAAELGLNVEDGAELLRMAADPEFDETSLTPVFWAPAWAWFLLGELKPAGAIPVLAGLLKRLETEEGDDSAGEILPQVFGMIGPATAPTLIGILRDEARSIGARGAAAEGVKQIAMAWPGERAAMIATLVVQLEERAVQDPTVNGIIVSVLLDLGAVEAAPALDRAFAAGRVDETIAGGWNEVQVTLGLKAAPRIIVENGATMRREAPKVGRNDPCSCGSGKKFKKCCGQ